MIKASYCVHGEKRRKNLQGNQIESRKVGKE
jgi:hypothetical protein